jgi:TorA maturation chaperone TorD
MTELLRALATFAEPPTDTLRTLCALLDVERAPTPLEYTEFFVFQQVPYASVYLGAAGMVGGEPRDRIAGFWRVLGCVPPNEPDHLSTLLGAYADMCDQHDAEPDATRRQRWARIRDAFLWEHLLSWLPVYLRKTQTIAPEPVARWAELLMEALRDEARRLPRPDAIPAHLRDAPPMPDPREQPSIFVASMLSPVRSGMILTRADLACAARELKTGGSVASRQVRLSALLEQEPADTIAWLASQAERWKQDHEAQRDELGPIADFWCRRAAATTTLLQASRQDLISEHPVGVE